MLQICYGFVTLVTDLLLICYTCNTRENTVTDLLRICYGFEMLTTGTSDPKKMWKMRGIRKSESLNLRNYLNSSRFAIQIFSNGRHISSISRTPASVGTFLQSRLGYWAGWELIRRLREDCIGVRVAFDIGQQQGAIASPLPPLTKKLSWMKVLQICYTNL